MMWQLVVSLLVTIIFSSFASAEVKYVCNSGWRYGNNCGKHWCYRLVPVPVKDRLLMIDQNFCGNFDKSSWPVSIHCKQENDFLWDKAIASDGFRGIGVYIPHNLPWDAKNFRNRDGTPMDFTSWTINKNAPINTEPNGYRYLKSQQYERAVGIATTGWGDLLPERISHLYCKTAAKQVAVEKPKPQNPPVKPTDFTCPAHWRYGNNCGKHWCYRLVEVPKKERELMIDNNFCARFDKRSLPASVHCKQENDFFWDIKYEQMNMRGIGVYIPHHMPYNVKSFRNRDKTPLDFTGWNQNKNAPTRSEPNGHLYLKYNITERLVGISVNGWWGDLEYFRIGYLYCKMPAIKVPQTTPTPRTTKPTPKTTTPRPTTKPTPRTTARNPTGKPPSLEPTQPTKDLPIYTTVKPRSCRV